MPNEKVISVIGVSDEDAAHLRLLMRRAAGDLTHAWRWGVDTAADLLVVDNSNFAGQMARARGKVSGHGASRWCATRNSLLKVILHSSGHSSWKTSSKY